MRDTRRLVLFDIDGTLITDGGAARYAFKIAIEETHGYRGDLAVQGAGGNPPARNQLVTGVGQRDKPSGDGRGSSSAVCLEHVAVDGDRALAQRLQISHCAQRAADEALNLLSATALFPFRRFTRRPGMR